MNVITKIVNGWDPIDLLSIAPSDEYDYEIHMIKQKILTHVDENVLADIIHEVFRTSFGDIFSKDIAECKKISKDILNML